ncbi:DUF6475 domain-containing protein [Candidatus Glomeribacter gigasporarum]|uniref:DUF6475 domain-containing protein n=1 Tax=Candidatus Glomeribacter gigasporarum TaxID=132144 RepID=UPI0002F74EFE|nr:DUF6475 domain-containing protein [Candidatus Glomeribacter gigasporarum]
MHPVDVKTSQLTAYPERFQALIQGVYDFYGKDLSRFTLSLWWCAMRPYDLAAVTDALNRHCVNPDTGQFLPKPADVVRMLGGSTQDAALIAWAKVDQAVRGVGPYQSVVFEDALIHRVLAEMGGWIPLGSKTEDEWPFVRNEFVNRYRGYRMRSETPDYPPVLIGLFEAQNRQSGYSVQPPVLVGDVEAAKRVMHGGTHQPLIGFTRMQLAPPEAQPALRIETQKKAA